jgi:hypothetical protein
MKEGKKERNRKVGKEEEEEEVEEDWFGREKETKSVLLCRERRKQ